TVRSPPIVMVPAAVAEISLLILRAYGSALVRPHSLRAVRRLSSPGSGRRSRLDRYTLAAATYRKRWASCGVLLASRTGTRRFDGVRSRRKTLGGQRCLPERSRR